MNWLVLVLLLATTLTGVVARWLPVHDCLWLDELHTSWVVSGRLSEVTPRAAMGNQSPVYFFGVWAVTQLLGQSELTLRLLSLVAGVLLIPATFMVATRWTNSPIAGLVAAALVAFQQQFLFYSTEARPYALVQLVGLIQVAFFARVCGSMRLGEKSTQARWSDRLMMIASSAILFYLHYTTALLFVAEAVAFAAMRMIAALRSSDTAVAFRRRDIDLALDFAIVAACCLPAVPALVSIGERRGLWDSLPTELPAHDAWRAMAICVALPASLAAATAIFRLLLKRRPIASVPNASAIVLTVAWLLVPGLIVRFADEFGWANLIHLRYIIVSAVAPMVLAALLCALAVGGRAQSLVALTVVVAALLTSPWLASVARGGRVVPDRNESWQALVEMINASEASKEEPVLVCSGLVEDGLLSDSDDRDFREYCLFAVSGIYSIDRNSRKIYAIATIPANDAPRFTIEQVEQVALAGGAWLVVRGRGASADVMEQDLLASLRSLGLKPRRRSRHSFGDLTAIWIGLD